MDYTRLYVDLSKEFMLIIKFCMSYSLATA